MFNLNMNSNYLNKKGYSLIIGDSELEVRKNPLEVDGYILRVKKTEDMILFPSGSLEDLARAGRDECSKIIKNLCSEFFFDKNPNLNYDSINSIVTKAFLKEEENRVTEIFKQK